MQLNYLETVLIILAFKIFQKKKNQSIISQG